MQTDRHRDMTKLAVAFLNSVNAYEKGKEGFQSCETVVVILGNSKTGDKNCSNNFVCKSGAGFVTEQNFN
jgi:hypothetical protein